MIANESPKYKTRELPPEIQKNIELSLIECENMDIRSVCCPYCGYVVAEIYADGNMGHCRFKCNKCKAVTTVNLRYFHRRKRKVSREEYLKRKYGIGLNNKI